MFHLAQVNIARARGPLDSAIMADFVGALDRINAVADAAPGFVWRYQDDSGAAIETQGFDDPLIIVNLSVWESLEALKAYTYRSDHAAVLRRRTEWFTSIPSPHLAMWWVPANHRPSVAEARERLNHLARHGDTQLAFTFRKGHDRPADPHPDVVSRLMQGHVRSRDRVNLDGRVFVPQRAAPTGDATPATRFAYQQNDTQTWATYSGGGVQHGALSARHMDGLMVMRYLHADLEGVAKLGTCVTAVEMMPTGRARLHERWCWDGDHDAQTSLLEEIAPA